MKKTALIALTLLIGFYAPRAHAQCETPITASAAASALANLETVHINQYTLQEINFTNFDLQQTATTEVLTRYDQFRNNLFNALNSFAEQIHPAMKDMTKQLGTAEVDQTRTLGSMRDARMQNETAVELGRLEVEARRRSEPAEGPCVVDNFAGAQTKGYRMARGIARGLALDHSRAMNNGQGTPAANGRGALIRNMYDDYENKYCDPANGDQGCAAAGLLAGQNNDLGNILWGDRQTVDMNSQDNRELMETVTRNIAGPFASEPIPAAAVRSATGVQATMERRARRARQNTITNSIGQMVGERAGGTGANTQDLRERAGTPAANASTDASYREIQQATMRERYMDPEYLFRVVNYPATVVRETGAINAQKLQQLSDLYKRAEEMVWIEGAVLGTQLDQRMPDNALTSAPLR